MTYDSSCVSTYLNLFLAYLVRGVIAILITGPGPPKKLALVLFKATRNISTYQSETSHRYVQRKSVNVNDLPKQTFCAKQELLNTKHFVSQRK